MFRDANVGHWLLGPTMSRTASSETIAPVAVSGRFSGMIGQNPRVSRSNRLHVVIFWDFFIDLKYILYIPLNLSVISLKFCTSTGYFCNSTSSFVTSSRFGLFSEKRSFCFSINKKATYWILFLKLRSHLHPQQCTLQVRKGTYSIQNLAT